MIKKVEIKNKTTGMIISREAEIGVSFLKRLRGLMFTSQPKDLVLVSPNGDIISNAIHMLFMRYPVGVVWADSNMTVVDLNEHAAPFSLFKPSTWRIYKPTKPAKYVIELGCGGVSNTAVGDALEFCPPIQK